MNAKIEEKYGKRLQSMIAEKVEAAPERPLSELLP